MLRLICFFVFVSFFANAGGIAVVNFALLEERAKVTQNIANQIKAKQDILQKEVEGIQKDVQKKVDDLEKSASVLTAKALEQKKANLQKELIQTDEKLKARASKLEKIKNDVLLNLNEQIKEVISSIAEKGGYDIVISESSAIYYHTKYDITEDVIKAVDKKIPSVKIDWL